MNGGYLESQDDRGGSMAESGGGRSPLMRLAVYEFG